MKKSIAQRRAVAYVRYSSDNQRDESLDAQIRAIKEYSSNNGLELVKVYQDKAKSATTDKRPEFQQMIKDSANDNFDVVIVHKLDRFSRDKYDSALYKRKLKQNGIRLISVMENLDDSPESVILESVIEGMAEYYSKNLARETMKGLKENAYKAKHTGGIPPLGYDLTPEKTYTINKKEAESVKLIFDMYITGYTKRKIVDELNARGFKTKINTRFKMNSIHSILTNEKYTGVYVFNKSSKKDCYGRRNNHKHKDESEIIRVEGGMPVIISKDIFQKAQEMLAKRKKSPGANKAKENYLLTGLMRCGDCGHLMYGNRRKPRDKPLYTSYRCAGRKEKNIKTCSNKEIRREYIEEYVLSELEKKVFSNKILPVLVDGINENLQKQHKTNKDKREVIEIESKEVNISINNIVTAITNGFVQEEFKIKMEELKERKIQLEEELNKLEEDEINNKICEEDVKGIIGSFKEYVVSKNIPECKKFIQDFVKEVIVYKEHIEVIFNVSFNFLRDSNSLEVISKIRRYDLYRRYSESFYIKVS